MSVTLKKIDNGKIIEVQITGKLSGEDYKYFVPDLEEVVKQHGKMRILFVMHEFHGWEPRALWEDIKFDFKHHKDIERLAIVGETKWQEGMSRFCKPFTSAKIKYFDQAQLEEARAWVQAA